MRDDVYMASKRNLRGVLIWLGLAAVALTSVGVGLLVGILWDPEPGLEQKTGERVVELILIILMGALISGAVELLRRAAASREKEREGEERWRTLVVTTLRSYLDRFDAVYQPVKNARRDVRLKVGYEFSEKINKDTYVEVTKKLNEHQLELEELFNVVSDIKGSKFRETDLPESDFEGVVEGLEEMKTYLDDIGTESERETCQFGNERGAVELPKLCAFVMGRKADPIKRDGQSEIRADFGEFVKGYIKTRRHLANALIVVESTRTLRPPSDVKPASESLIDR